jgi:hypothetical protein
MLTLAVMVVFGAAAPVRLAAPPAVMSGAEASEVHGWSIQLAEELTHRGVEVLAGPTLAAVLGGQQALFACGEDGCAAELAEATGADGTLRLGVAALEGRYTIDLRVVSRTGALLAAASMTALERSAMSDAVHTLAREVVTQLRPKFQADRIPPEQGRLKRTHAMFPALFAGVVGGIGVWMVQSSYGQPHSALETAGWVTIGVAATSLVAAIVILFLGEPP